MVAQYTYLPYNQNSFHSFTRTNTHMYRSSKAQQKSGFMLCFELKIRTGCLAGHEA